MAGPARMHFQVLVTRVFAPACIGKMTSKVQILTAWLAPAIVDEIT
jgi:hypothetical protein